MNSNEWRSRITVGSPVVLGGESHVIQAVTEWVTLRAMDGTTRRVSLSSLIKMLAEDEVRRRFSELVTGWQTDLLEEKPREGSSALTDEETERLVRAFLRYRVHHPGSTREDPTLRAGASRHPSTSQTRKADTPHRMALRPGQSLSINVTVSIVDRADGKE